MLLMVKMIMLERFWRQKRNGFGETVDGKEEEEEEEEVKVASCTPSQDEVFNMH